MLTPLCYYNGVGCTRADVRDGGCRHRLGPSLIDMLESMTKQNMPTRGRVVKTRAPKVEAKLADGWVFIADTRSMPGAWGKGKTEREALSNLRLHAWDALLRETGHVIWCCHPDPRVDDHGYVCWPSAGDKPLLVENKLKIQVDLSEFETV